MRNPLPAFDAGQKLQALNANLQQAYAAFRTGQAQQAEMLCLQILAARAGEPNALHLLGIIANAQRLLDKAIAYLRRACLAPDAPAVAFSDLGEMLRQKGRADEAETLVRKSIALNDKLSNAWNNLGVLLQHNGDTGARRAERLTEARSCFDRAIILQPDYFEAYWNRGTLALLQGEFEKAWPDFEWRKRKQGHNLQIASAQPIWSGIEDISNKTVLVHWEQGLGDTIQFSRYIELFTKIAGKVLFWPQKSLIALMRNADLGGAELVDFENTTLNYDFRTPLMSLAVLMKTALNTIPSKPAYMKPEAERVEKWRAKIGSKGFKIGISWKGSSGPIDAGRSIPLTHFLPLLDLPDVRLISLQKYEGLYQLHALPAETRIENLGDEFDAGTDAFLDSAAVMSLCDLVITSDTAIAHLAGALGVRTWLGLKQTPDWRWLLDRQDSPWYPAMRLYRQKRANDWAGVFDDIQSDLKRILSGEELSLAPLPKSPHDARLIEHAAVTGEMVSLEQPEPPQKSIRSKPKKTEIAAPQNVTDETTNSTVTRQTDPSRHDGPLPLPVAPISWGEFIDKLTILEIKRGKLTDKTALGHVVFELEKLNAAADPRWLTDPALLDLQAQLRTVNESLWVIEDDIRDKEAKHEFDEAFIQLARSVYQRNDERAKIKKAINHLVKSEIVEEKLYKSYD